MNVFEDLIIELKEENLLESTVIPTPQRSSRGVPISDSRTESDVLDDPEISTDGRDEADLLSAEIGGSTELPTPIEELTEVKKPAKGKEFYKKRAVGEVSNLQMVEHVLTGVEREYLKVVPKSFDDFNVKKTLHAFMQVTEGENSESHQEAEFELMQETEAWCTALADRDRTIPVSSVRQYCENSRPALSSQAMLAMARFYRNLPYTETVRSKFDFVITRLFSRPADEMKRACLFSREETLKHINTLYRDWSSIPLYAAGNDEATVMLTALSFEDLARESEQASTFDQLIKSDFFGRLRNFKESINDLFYAPTVTAAAIEANIRIGNSYVTLINKERQKMDAESIQAKYENLSDESVSDAAGRTLEIVELLKGDVPPSQEPQVSSVSDADHRDMSESRIIPSPRPKKEKQKADKLKSIGKKASEETGLIHRLKENLLNVNRWFLGFAVAAIAVSIGLYVWANVIVKEEVSSTGVKNVAVETSALTEFARSIKVSGDNMYVMLKPSWDALSKERRLEVLQIAYQMSKENGARQVTLLDRQGRSAGFASSTRQDLTGP